MSQVLLVNPSTRPGARSTKGKKMAKAKTRKARRTPAQVAATKRMIAANKAKRSRPARSAPKRKTASRAAPARSAPRRKAKRKTWSITPAPVASRAGRQLRYRRRNPVGGIGEFVSKTLMPSVIGGGGALALDVLMGIVPLPPAITTGPLRPVVKVAGAVGLGMVAGMVTNRRVGEQVAAGAITVTMYELARALVAKSGMKVPGLSEYVDMYPDGGPEMLGYQSSGMQVGTDDMGVGEYVDGYETGVYR